MPFYLQEPVRDQPRSGISERRTETVSKSLTFLAEEIGKQQKKVEDSERAMAQYRESNNALSLEDRQNTVVGTAREANFYGRSHRSFTRSQEKRSRAVSLPILRDEAATNP